MWAVLASKSTLAVTPSMAFRAFSTRPEQWAHIMPSIIMVFFIAVSPFSSVVSIMVWVSTTASVAFSCWFLWNLGLKSLTRRALETTQTELMLMAAAPNMGFSFQPKELKNTPAASGMPMEL